MQKGSRFLVGVCITCTMLVVTIGCRHVDIRPYHSNAFKPRTVTQVSTQMTVVACDENDARGSNEIGVIAAHDQVEGGQSYSYILLAPVIYSHRSASEMSNLDVNQGAVIREDQVPIIVRGLRNLLAEWDKQISSDKAEFWEFVSIPQDQERVVSDSVISYSGTLRMAFNRTVNGPNLTIVLSEKNYIYAFFATTKEEVRCLTNKIETAGAMLK